MLVETDVEGENKLTKNVQKNVHCFILFCACFCHD